MASDRWPAEPLRDEDLEVADALLGWSKKLEDTPITYEDYLRESKEL